MYICIVTRTWQVAIRGQPVCIHTYICIYTYISVCVCIYACGYIYTYIY